jgi:hypothetical protein
MNRILQLYSEQWLIRKLQKFTKQFLDAGVTTAEERCENIRAAILAHGLADTVIGRGRDGQRVTYALAFWRLYGCELLEVQAA